MKYTQPTKIRLDNCTLNIETGAIIDEGVILGYSNIQKPRARHLKKDVHIGAGSIIRTGAIIYEGTLIGDNSMIGHNVIIRENTTIGSGNSIGDFTKIEGYCTIGNGNSIWTHSHITSFSEIGDNCFIGPNFISLNDPVMSYKRPKMQEQRTIKGPTIGNNVRISAGVIVQPSITIGDEAVIGTGSVVTKDVPAGQTVLGVPAKFFRDVPKEHYLDN